MARKRANLPTISGIFWHISIHIVKIVNMFYKILLDSSTNFRDFL